MTLIDTIAERITLGPPPGAIEGFDGEVAIHLLDTVSAWIAGRATSEGKQLYDLRRGGGHTPALFDASLLDSIALTTATARLTEVDDIHMASCSTPGAIVTLTALAIAAQLPPDRRSAERLSASIITGYEVMTRLGQAVDGPQMLHEGIWPTLLLAPVTTAAIASTLLGLNTERTAQALSIALAASTGRPGGSASAGVSPGEGTSARWLLLGLATRTGCAAAFSAARGFDGDRGLLDNNQAAALQGLTISPAIIKRFFQEGPAVQETSIKPYCTAKHNIAAIYAFQQLLENGISQGDLTKIRVGLPASHAHMVGHNDVQTSRLSRITSCAHNIALAALSPDGLLDIEHCAPELGSDIARYADKVEVFVDADLQPVAPHAYPATVELFIEERMVASKTIIDAWGDPKLAFDISATRSKFRRLTRGVIGDGAASRIESLCANVFNSNNGARELWEALGAIDKDQVDKVPATHLVAA
ncbi:MmgE/PrpD family protein [Polaromonas sp.]|uniref:MmgE/PrpD family protein n=1 Tax=Polaromonas sp. TaxID=1869339 RepID=UPI003BA9D5D4